MARTREGRRKAAYRKNNQNRFSIVLVVIVVLILTVTVAISCARMSNRLEELEAQIVDLQQQQDVETKRAEEIEEFRKYAQTPGYYEEVAKEKLGLVYEGEIVFKEED